MKLSNWLKTFSGEAKDNPNLVFVQMEAVFLGILFAADPFLAVFLARLGATNVQIGLLSAMPAITGLLFTIFIGNYLQNRRKIIPWYIGPRLFTVIAYFLTGFIPLLLPRQYAVIAILVIWAVATLPSIILTLTFNVVMNAVSGPTGRYELMARRWAILGVVTSVVVAASGWLMDRFPFPVNFEYAFILLSVTGGLGLLFGRRIQLPENLHPSPVNRQPLGEKVRAYIAMLKSAPAFLSFTTKRFVYYFGFMLAIPLYPIYLVREVHASNTWIGYISTVSNAIIVIGYFFWMKQSKRRSNHTILLWATTTLALYPALFAALHQVELIVVLAGVFSFFQAAMDLVFFDELMKTVPPEASINFISFAQSTYYVTAVVAPLLGSFLAEQIGLPAALVTSTVLRLLGAGLFYFGKRKSGADKAGIPIKN